MMEGTYYKEWSAVLDREMEFKVYGHGGVPVLALPARGGRFYDWENNGMPDAAARLLHEGKIQLFCADSIDGESLLAGNESPRRRAEMQEKYFVYLTSELAARIAELNAPVVVEVLHTRYPQGAEKQLVQAVSGRQVPSGKLPADAGCCIFNLNTTCAIYRAVYTGMPVVNKVVTVSGSGVIDPKNIECPIGTPITKLFDACGGLKYETYKLIMGGPMMGLAQYDVDVTVGKGTGAMLAFADKEEQYVEDPQCIRCGKCVGVCPIRLEPVFMYKYLMKGDVDTWQNVLHGMDCIECGACTYTCPARLPLTHAFRLGKQEVNNARMAAKAKAEAEAKAAAEKKEA